MQNQARYRSVFVSDLHLGSVGGKAAAACEFLRTCECDHLFLVGDILDGWVGRNPAKWRQDCSDVVTTILTKSRTGTKVYYTPGNHDAFLRRMNGTQMGSVTLAHSFVHTLADGRLALVEHGDLFDRSCTTYRPVAVAGAWAYEFALYANIAINKIRRRRNQPPVDFCCALKQMAKRIAKPKGGFAAQLSEHARAQDCNVVICGHVHRPEIREMPSGVLYANTGDWVEHLTALTEDDEGKLHLMSWAERQSELFEPTQLVPSLEGAFR